MKELSPDEIQIGEVRLSLDEARETLAAIRAGKVDAVMVEGEAGQEIYTFRDPSHPYRLLVEAMSEGAALTTPDGMICYENPHLAELVGTPRMSMYGRPLAELVAFSQRPRLEALFERVRAGQPARDNVELIGNDGRLIPVQISVSPALLLDVAIVCVVVTDLTEQRRQEELYRAARLEIEARDRLFSVAAHELRTPLGVVELQTHLLQQLLRANFDGGSAPIERALTMVQRIREQGRLLGELISKLLDVGSIGAGRLQLARTRVDLGQIVRNVLERMEDEIRGSGSAVTADLGRAEGLWDQVRIEQVVRNLLTNAAKYGLGRPIHVAVQSDETMARLCVDDQGKGIPPEARERIFRPYERMIGSEGVPGLGLGLYITAEIVKAHGGTIRVTASPGGGARFLVELPREPEGG